MELGLDTVIDVVSMQFPFEVELKQVLLEAIDHNERLEVLRAALALDSVGSGTGSPRH